MHISDMAIGEFGRACWVLSGGSCARGSGGHTDARVREIVMPYAQVGRLRYDVQVELAWGVPRIV